jgi:HSP20 family protein
MRNSLTRSHAEPVRPAWDLGDLFGGLLAPTFARSNALPALDLREDTEAYTLEVEVPGYTMDRINVHVADNVLTLTAERAEEIRNAEGNGQGNGNGGNQQNGRDEVRWHVMERSSGAFSRSIKFPVPIEAQNVRATLRNGVLTITVPKSAAARAQKIKITEA